MQSGDFPALQRPDRWEWASATMTFEPGHGPEDQAVTSAHAVCFVGESVVLSHQQAVARIVEHCAMFADIRFELNLVVAGDDGEHVAIVYQSPMRTADGTELTIASMEIFRVVDGRIIEVWNCGYKQGEWQ